MDEFMRKLDLAIQDHAGLTARIRCFGYANDSSTHETDERP